jgi:hypothetical protein
MQTHAATYVRSLCFVRLEHVPKNVRAGDFST